ncbi:uncharacterized protein [Littorina saxatilis]|uniref:uncharacterized protein n=1 Tax=Littorina saxatilis TaxID=31220 RepID=UPI0038B63A4E
MASVTRLDRSDLDVFLKSGIHEPNGARPAPASNPRRSAAIAYAPDLGLGKAFRTEHSGSETAIRSMFKEVERYRQEFSPKIICLKIYCNYSPTSNCTEHIIGHIKQWKEQNITVSVSIIFAALYHVNRQSCRAACKHKSTLKQKSDSNAKGLQVLNSYKGIIEISPFRPPPTSDWTDLMRWNNLHIEGVPDEQRKREDAKTIKDFNALLTEEIPESAVDRRFPSICPAESVSASAPESRSYMPIDPSGHQSFSQRAAPIARPGPSGLQSQAMVSSSQAPEETMSTTPPPGSQGPSGPQYYRMTNNRRGICLILNNKFAGGPHQRRGTETDTENLQMTFKALGFLVEVKDDLTAEEMCTFVADSAKRDHRNFDCFVCCILTHGTEGGLQGNDVTSIVRLDKLAEPLYTSKCPSLGGKPKLFFTQACRGSNKQGAAEVDSDNITSMESEEEDATTRKIPDRADFFYSYATTDGHVSYRHPTKGSRYVSVLCHVLNQYSDDDNYDINDIMTIVHNEVSNKKGQTQMPSYESTLTKKLIFMPLLTPVSGFSYSSNMLLHLATL